MVLNLCFAFELTHDFVVLSLNVFLINLHFTDVSPLSPLNEAERRMSEVRRLSEARKLSEAGIPRRASSEQIKEWWFMYCENCLGTAK